MDKLYLDLEFYGDELLCCGVKWNNLRTHVEETIAQPVKDLLAHPNTIKVCHSKADWRWLKQNGYEVAGPLEDTMVKAWVLDENTPLTLEDCARRYCGIKMDKRIKSINKEPYFRTDHDEWVHLKDAPLTQVMKYNAEDVEATYRLDQELNKRMDAQAWRYYYEEEQRPFTSVLLDMECNGLPIDLDAAAVLKEKLLPRIKNQEGMMDKLLGYKLVLADGRPGYGSSDLLAKVLFETVWYQEGKIEHGQVVGKAALRDWCAKYHDIKKSEVTDEMIEEIRERVVRDATPPGFVVQKVTPKNLVGYYVRKGYDLPATPPADPDAKNPKPSTAMPVLLSTFPDHEFIKELQEWSKLRKVVTTYLDAYPKYTKDGRLYGTFSQTGTKTGRLSSARPNLQNQPAQGWLGKEIRSLFKGRLVVGDYSQLEPRLLAHFSQDEKLLEVYDKGIDVYAVTAAGIFGGHYKDYGESHPQRKMAKPLFLGDQYGAGYKKLTMLLRLNGFPVTDYEVQKFQARLHSTYATATAWKHAMVREAHRTGYVQTLDGHRRRLGEKLRDKNWKNRGYGERQAVNAIIQGSAGDVVRRAMVAAHSDFPELMMLAQVHDEVLFEARPGVLMSSVQDMLWDMKYVFEVGHDFDLSVPLVFDPQIVSSWAGKGGNDDIDWGEDEA